MGIRGRECRAPSHNPILFDQETKYQQHAIQEHDVPEKHIGILSNAARRPYLDKEVLECPFGDHFQPPEEIEPSAVFANEALQLHVARAYERDCFAYAAKTTWQWGRIRRERR